MFAQLLNPIDRAVLEQLALQPDGISFSHARAKIAVVALAKHLLVCDPHTIGDSLFTRITEEGRAYLAQK